MVEQADRRATVRDVAELAGVSPATVSYVLSGRSSGRSAGSAETRARVRAAADQLAYRPHRAARGARTGRAGTILLAMMDLEDPWVAALATTIRDEAARRGQAVLLLPSDSWFDLLASLPMDAAFISRPDVLPGSGVDIRHLVRQGMRLVVFSDDLQPDGYDVVRGSSASAAALAGATLAAHGGDVGYVATYPTTGNSLGTRRWEGFARGLAEAGITVDRDRDACRSARADAVAAFLATRRPRGVVVDSVGAGLTTYVEATRLGLRVPEDLEIITIGNVPDHMLSWAPLSHVGVADFFRRMARIVVGRAMDPSRPTALHQFDLEVVHCGTTVV